MKSGTLHKLNPKAKLVFSGNSNFLDEKYSENHDVKSFFKLFGYRENINIFYELESKSTYENLLYTKKLINSKSSNKWVVVSSAYHLNRISLIAKKIGWDIYVYPSNYKINDINYFSKNNWSFATTFLREISATIFYKLKGRI